MAIALTPRNKNTIALTFRSKEHGETWNDATYTWNETTGTWDVPSISLIERIKNTISLSLRNKL